MGNVMTALSSSEIGELVFDNILGESKAEANYAKQKAALEKKNNINLLNESLGSYRAKLGSMGIHPGNGSALAVQEKMVEDTKDKNQSADLEVRQKVNDLRRGKKKKLLTVASKYAKKELNDGS